MNTRSLGSSSPKSSRSMSLSKELDKKIVSTSKQTAQLLSIRRSRISRLLFSWYQLLLESLQKFSQRCDLGPCPRSWQSPAISTQLLSAGVMSSPSSLSSSTTLPASRRMRGLLTYTEHRAPTEVVHTEAVLEPRVRRCRIDLRTVAWHHLDITRPLQS